MNCTENWYLAAVMDPASLSLGVASLAIQVYQGVKQGKEPEVADACDFQRFSDFSKDMHTLKMPPTCLKIVAA